MCKCKCRCRCKRRRIACGPAGLQGMAGQGQEGCAFLRPGPPGFSLGCIGIQASPADLARTAHLQPATARRTPARTSVVTTTTSTSTTNTIAVPLLYLPHLSGALQSLPILSPVCSPPELVRPRSCLLPRKIPAPHATPISLAPKSLFTLQTLHATFPEHPMRTSPSFVATCSTVDHPAFHPSQTPQCLIRRRVTP